MITLYGFYQYKPDLMDGVILPDGMDKDNLINLIMEKSGMLYPLHQQPDYLKVSITNWFHRRLRGFTCMYQALQEEYSPIENYDRYEEYTDTPNVDYTKTGGHTNSVNNHTEAQSSGEVSAYNASTYSPDTQTNTEQTGNSTETITYNTEKTSETGTRKHSGHLHGNIGVTTNQQMIEAELSLRVYDLYDTIATLFEKNFLLQVY